MVPIIVIAIVAGLVGVWIGFLIGKAQGTGSAEPGGTSTSKPKRAKSGTELYVGNISYDTTEEALAKAFQRYGKVQGARIICKKSNGQSRGYGFVVMEDEDSARAAAKGLNGSQVDGRALVVNEARTRSKLRR